MFAGWCKDIADCLYPLTGRIWESPPTSQMDLVLFGDYQLLRTPLNSQSLQMPIHQRHNVLLVH